MLISIIFSFRNEAENLRELIDRVTNALSEVKDLSYELIFVNDNSDDESLNILLERKKEFPIKVINMSRRFGVAPSEEVDRVGWLLTKVLRHKKDEGHHAFDGVVL